MMGSSKGLQPFVGDENKSRRTSKEQKETGGGGVKCCWGKSRTLKWQIEGDKWAGCERCAKRKEGKLCSIDNEMTQVWRRCFCGCHQKLSLCQPSKMHTEADRKTHDTLSVWAYAYIRQKHLLSLDVTYLTSLEHPLYSVWDNIQYMSEFRLMQRTRINIYCMRHVTYIGRGSLSER